MRHPYLEHDGPIVFAHRGGAREAPENTRMAFDRCARLGFTYIETDVRATLDGVPVIFHDAALQRVSDRFGRIRDLPFSEVSKARIAGVDTVASLEETLATYPDIRFNIDIKEDNAVEPTLDVLERMQVLDRVAVAAFSWRRLRRVRERFGDRVCTALAPQEVAALVSRARLGRVSVASRFLLPQGPVCVQIPERATAVTVAHRRLVDLAHSRGWPVHVWTVNDPDAMGALLDVGVDGLISDRPSVVREVIQQRRMEVL